MEINRFLGINLFSLPSPPERAVEHLVYEENGIGRYATSEDISSKTNIFVILDVFSVRNIQENCEFVTKPKWGNHFFNFTC